uniref:Uncharacterized protein n=1 Tax=Arundo donax TaxID=35708 RepID=A0A0A9FEW4_ARUDO
MACNVVACAKLYFWVFSIHRRARHCVMHFVLNCSMLEMPLFLHLRCAEISLLFNPNVVHLFIPVSYKTELE